MGICGHVASMKTCVQLSFAKKHRTTTCLKSGFVSINRLTGYCRYTNKFASLDHFELELGPTIE